MRCVVGRTIKQVQGLEQVHRSAANPSHKAVCCIVQWRYTVLNVPRSNHRSNYFCLENEKTTYFHYIKRKS